MKKIQIITLLICSNLAFSQGSVDESKSFDKLTSEELFQIGEISAINSYKKNLPNAITGFFLGSTAMDLTSLAKVKDFKMKKWTSKLSLDEDIIESDWFVKGFISKRKELVIESMRRGRVIGRLVITAAVSILLLNEFEILWDRYNYY